MSPQSEFALENSLISQLEGMEYSFIAIEDECQMLANLRRQLETHNKITFTDSEFNRVLNHLNSGEYLKEQRFSEIAMVYVGIMMTLCTLAS